LKHTRRTRTEPLTPAALWPASCSIFLEHGADVNVTDEERWRPLHHAAHFSSLRVLPLLLAAPGVDVNAPSNKRWRPIDACGSAAAARMLLDAGAVVASAAPGSLSALHHAAFKVRPDVVAELLARGASVTERFSPEAGNASWHLDFGGTALHLAVASLSWGHKAREMYGSSFGLLTPEMADAQGAAKRRVAVCEALVAAGADLGALTNPYSWSPLVTAAQYGDAAVIKALLRAGAPPNAVAPGAKMTALHAAALQGHIDAIYELAAGGADVSCHPLGERHAQPLLAAVLHNRHGAVRALLELGADSTVVAALLARPPAALLPRVVDDKTRALMARHRTGTAAPARACSLPECEARRRVDYDDKRLLVCPCKVRRTAAASAARMPACAWCLGCDCAARCRAAACLLLLQGAPADGPQAPQGGVQSGAGRASRGGRVLVSSSRQNCGRGRPPSGQKTAACV
jgi:ankyrin repeat protein